MIDRKHFETTFPNIVHELRSVYDPEIPIDVFELGLIYDIVLQEGTSVDVTMTLTAPNCPVAGELPQWIQEAVEKAGHDKVRIELTFDPPWTPEMVSDDGRLYLGM